MQLKHIQSTTFQAKVTPGIGKGNIMKIDTYVKIASVDENFGNEAAFESAG